MELGLRGRRALVTGAGRGLGRSIALCLAKEGAFVAGISRTASELQTLVEEIGSRASGHLAIAADLMEEGDLDRAMSELTNQFGFPEIVVHNLGGTLEITDPLCPLEDWERVWRFNLGVAVELNRRLIPRMRERKWGRIVHVSSISGAENHGPIPYCSVKAATIAYARSMGRYLAQEGIIVTAILPGAVFTEGGYWDFASRERPEHVRKYLDERMAIHRFGQPDEIGRVVAFLCSEAASFCVGSIVPVDGGQGRSFFGI